MLTVKTSIRKSAIEGLGLFAEENIPKGTTIWRYDPRFDISFEAGDVQNMETLQKNFILRYAYLSTETGKYILSIDNDRFMNHSSKNNNLDLIVFPGEPETRAIANREIKIGEEILIDYKKFDSADASAADPYLNK